jgi:D-sedoheptulose 7-phosphate isomerase
MPTTFLALYKAAVLQAVETIDLGKLERAIGMLREARDKGRSIFVCGNGGSAATASHFACELVKGASYGRSARFRVLALSDSVSTITAYANDVDYACAFVEQLKNFAQPGDVVIAFSSSGNSPSVVRAIEYGNSAGCRTIAFSGREGSALGRAAQLNLQVPHPHLGRVEDAQFIMAHMICYYFMENPDA